MGQGVQVSGHCFPSPQKGVSVSLHVLELASFITGMCVPCVLFAANLTSTQRQITPQTQRS